MVIDKVIILGIGWYKLYLCLRINGKLYIYVIFEVYNLFDFFIVFKDK